MIRMHPWAGIGFGEFDIAWTPTPFSGRPVAFLDHTHDIVLQFLVELGSASAARAQHARLRPGSCVPPCHAAGDAAAPLGEAMLRHSDFMMALLIRAQSLLDYPLWYAHYLLPAAFVFGLCLAEPPSSDRTGAAAHVATTVAP